MNGADPLIWHSQALSTSWSTAERLGSAAYVPLCWCSVETRPGGNRHPGKHVQGCRLQLRVRTAAEESRGEEAPQCLPGPLPAQGLKPQDPRQM